MQPVFSRRQREVKPADFKGFRISAFAPAGVGLDHTHLLDYHLPLKPLGNSAQRRVSTSSFLTDAIQWALHRKKGTSSTSE